MIKNKKTLSYLLWIVMAIAAFAAGLLISNQLSYDFKTLDGEKYDHADLRGKIVVVNYFAEWCAPCLREIPELNKFYHQADDKIKLFAISFDNLGEEQLAKIKKQYNIEFPIISSISTNFEFEKPEYLPATFIIKPSGEVAGQLLGEQTTNGLNEAISAF